MFKKLKDRFGAALMHFLGSVDEPFYSPLNALANRIRLWQHPERVTHPGTLHPDKTFYVIRDLPADTGLASWYDRAIGYVLRAEKKGWTPIIDPPPLALEGAGDWYAFFEAPSSVPVAEALQGRNVVMATTLGVVYKRYNPNEIEKRHRLAARLALNEETRAFVETRAAEFLGDSSDGLVGAYYRCTDYRRQNGWNPIGHPKVPDVDGFCTMLEETLRRWNIPVAEGERIFIVTEEQEALEAIRQRFPKCRFVEKERYAHFDWRTNVCRTRLVHTSPLENNRLYLLDLYVLSKCDYLVGTMNGGMLMALNWNGNRYKGVHIPDYGVN